MDKKQYLISLLTTLIPHWKPAEGFLIILEHGDYDPSLIDILIKMITEAVQSVESESAKKVLTWSLAVLERVKQMEAKSRIQDEADCEELLGMLEGL